MYAVLTKHVVHTLKCYMEPQKTPGGTWHRWNKATVGYSITVFPFHVRRVQMIEVRNGKLNKTPSNKFPFHEP